MLDNEVCIGALRYDHKLLEHRHEQGANLLGNVLHHRARHFDQPVHAGLPWNRHIQGHFVSLCAMAQGPRHYQQSLSASLGTGPSG